MLPKILEDLDKRRQDEPDAVAAELEQIWPRLNKTREIPLAYGIMGSCLRNKGEISAALWMIDHAIEKAEGEWERAHLWQRRSLTVGATGDFELAFADSDRALIGYLHSGDNDYMGRVVSEQAMWRFHQGSFAECIKANQLALRLLEKSNSAYRFTCHQGSALAAIEVHDRNFCLAQLKLAKPLAEEVGQIPFARFRWTEARLLERAGRPDLATEALVAAREIFWFSGNVHDAALASVAIVENQWSQGRVEEAAKEGVACRKLLVHLPDSNFAVPILAAVWKQSEARSLSQRFLREALESLQNGRRSAHLKLSSQPPGT